MNEVLAHVRQNQRIKPVDYITDYGEFEYNMTKGVQVCLIAGCDLQCSPDDTAGDACVHMAEMARAHCYRVLSVH